jgi:predicted transposase YdaD
LTVAPKREIGAIMESVVHTVASYNQAIGKAEGKAEGKADSILLVLRSKFTKVSKSLEKQIYRISDLNKLEELLIQAVKTESINDLKKFL